ncbi:hypothetical protein V757_06010, partial [Pelistega indica]
RYEECCQPYHLQIAYPKKPELLMRSRYSAYVLGLVDYIVKTTVPAQQALLDRVAIEQWSHQVAWKGLDVLQVKNIPGSHQAKVEFNAYYTENGVDKVHHEYSVFLKISGQWYFKDPSV